MTTRDHIDAYNIEHITSMVLLHLPDRYQKVITDGRVSARQLTLYNQYHDALMNIYYTPKGEIEYYVDIDGNVYDDRRFNFPCPFNNPLASVYIFRFDRRQLLKMQHSGPSRSFMSYHGHRYEFATTLEFDGRDDCNDFIDRIAMPATMKHGLLMIRTNHQMHLTYDYSFNTRDRYGFQFEFNNLRPRRDFESWMPSMMKLKL